MAAPRRKKAAKAPAKTTKAKPTATTKTKAKPAAKSGLLASLAQYVAKKASGLVKRTKKKRAKRPATKKPKKT